MRPPSLTHSRWSRRAAGEEGFGIFEVIAAVMVLAVGIVAVAQLATTMVTTTLRVRQREAGVAEANREIEELRTNGYGNLKLKPAGAPATYTDEGGVSYNTLRDTPGTCSACLDYTTTRTVNEFNFVVRRVVAAVDDGADGTGASDADSDPLDYKKVFVEIASTSGPAFTYHIQTSIHDVTKDPAVTVQGMHLEVLDLADGTVVNDDALTWTITLSGPNNVGDELDEGVYDNFNLASGAYTCTIANTESTRLWHPQGFPTANSESFGCSVTNGQITSIQRTWANLDCQVMAGRTGDLYVQVNRADGTPVAGATVDPEPLGGQSNPASRLTDALGIAAFPGVATGSYSVSVTKTGYVGRSGLETCVSDVAPETLNVYLDPPPTRPAGVAEVRVTYTGRGAKKFKVLVGTLPIEQDVKQNETKVFTFELKPANYDVKIFCVPKPGKENLKETYLGRSFGSDATGYVPGPTSATSYSTSKC